MLVIISFILGIALLGFIMWLKNRKISLTWYEWLIGIVGLALLLFTIQSFTDAMAEVEPKAASIFLLFIGLPSLVLLAISWQLAVRRLRKA